ncbi:hypothetical protein VTL71DRAFT_1073 [Oculimacula yallundae]|uniref:Transcription factor Iwr1 domain-containing protein n=1 Tax=Oculimacula yallundae TaxID=86028 RepID=A0ABR4D220_9HELO
MSLPPSTVKIKRKATDDPVEFLRIHESTGSGKRQRQDSEYIFSRQPAGNDPAARLISSPVPRKIKELPRSSASHDAAQILPPTTTALSNTPATPRRFHISKSAALSNNTNATAGGGRKRKAQPTVFVERRIRPKSADGTPGGSPTPEESGGQNIRDTAAIKTPETPKEQTATPTQQLKKPGKNARSATPVRPVTPPKPSPAPLRNVLLPNGSMMPWDVSSERLAAEMQAYTLQEIGKTIAANEAQRPPPVSRRIKTPSKFKPKPALRYLERHPEHKVQSSMEVDEEYIVEEMDDDSEYIIDTYIRVPAIALEESEGGHKNIGLLVLESQPDIDEFYREDEDSDEEEDEADEDENAENHYTADYPDEEVDSDDEFDRNAYNYRNHNASDLEEFDENDATFSDDENKATKYPWMTKPWVKKSAIDTAMDDSD